MALFNSVTNSAACGALTPNQQNQNITLRNMKSYFLKFLLYSLTISFLIIMYTFNDVLTNKRVSPVNIFSSTSASVRKSKMKYILQWTSSETVPFIDMGEGQSGFINRKCPFVNCFVTSNRLYLGNYTKFDVIAFAGPQLIQTALDKTQLPQWRSPHQKYVFASIESAAYYSVCTDKFNDFFNWTWTYKLNSDVRWGYIVVRDKEDNIIGPKKDMHWLKLEDMDPVPGDFKKKLKSKRKAAVWFVSNCFTISNRHEFAEELAKELRVFNYVLDIYGKCSTLSCSRENEIKCDKKIADNYYFYLSFENAFSEDYVTEKLLRALNNNAVPIVYGGANYTRFMPDGIYLNARELGAKRLAEKMYELIKDPDKYAECFKWKNHYSYHMTSESVETNEYCRFCEILNDEDAVNTHIVYNIQEWWNPPGACVSSK